ncbi:rhomboid family intramembrane serine protease [Streptomyces sp. NPDC051993]|uniref:rhomboid family intramembrane serine protease n=1 Tax=Streptomyces sp. NPDC051993 TaxID=3155286 RepID=UPI00343314F9
MTLHMVILYCCAAAVVVPGTKIIQAEAGGRRVSPVELLRILWRRPVPWAAVAVIAAMAVMAAVQTVAPSVMDHLQREPGAPWWRAVTALLVQTSGWPQLTFNLAAAVVVTPVAQRLLGPVLMPLVFLVSGVAAQAVSMAGWSVTGGGDSVALCGLVGALAIARTLHAATPAARLLPLLVPAAGLVLCALSNNHGVGVLTGCVLGAIAMALPGRRPRPLEGRVRRPSAPATAPRP